MFLNVYICVGMYVCYTCGTKSNVFLFLCSCITQHIRKFYEICISLFFYFRVAANMQVPTFWKILLQQLPCTFHPLTRPTHFERPAVLTPVAQTYEKFLQILSLNPWFEQSLTSISPLPTLVSSPMITVCDILVTLIIQIITLILVRYLISCYLTFNLMEFSAPIQSITCIRISFRLQYQCLAYIFFHYQPLQSGCAVKEVGWSNQRLILIICAVVIPSFDDFSRNGRTMTKDIVKKTVVAVE